MQQRERVVELDAELDQAVFFIETHKARIEALEAENKRLVAEIAWQAVFVADVNARLKQIVGKLSRLNQDGPTP